MAKGSALLKITKIDEVRYMIEKTGNMRVPGIIYADSNIFEEIKNDESVLQVKNVAELPGIVKYSLAMPDIHAGYGFPIGGVAAFDIKEGIISPGGVGYDINCGIRIVKTNLTKEEIIEDIKNLTVLIYQAVPSGVGSKVRGGGKVKKADLKKICERGAGWAVEHGFGDASDLNFIEDNGCIKGASFSEISKKAVERGLPQVGTLGSGNHFIEIGYVDKIYDEKAARVFGLFKDQVLISVHTGSRGFGHQIATDFIRLFQTAVTKYNIKISDRQLVCAPFMSDEGQAYFQAMACAANFAFNNRQMIMHRIREVFEGYFKRSYVDMGMFLLYDVAHNIAKVETHTVDGKKVRVCVHRKGATRSFSKGSPDIPEEHRQVGQVVIIPGDMGRYSFVLVGKEGAMNETFGSSCHGAGRVLSRHQSIKMHKGRNIQKELSEKGIYVVASGKRTILEEAPMAYKDVSNVVNVVAAAGIAGKVARIRPMGVVKG